MKNPFSGVFRAGIVASFFSGVMALTTQAQTLVYTNIWSIAPNSRPYVTSGTTERGVAISPVDNTVYIVSRAAGVGGLGIFVLNGETGEEILTESSTPLQLSTAGISGGGLVLNSIGVAEDGVIYACNVATAVDTLKFIVGPTPIPSQRSLTVPRNLAPAHVMGTLWTCGVPALIRKSLFQVRATLASPS